VPAPELTTPEPVHLTPLAPGIDSRHAPHDLTRPDVDLVVPVYNEVADLPGSIARLSSFVARLPYRVRITIADNASTDGTWELACDLADAYDGVVAVHLAEKGRGRALHATWSASDARVLAYCDVDLSTDLAALLPLVAPLLSGHSDLAIGSRLTRGSRVTRGPKRELVSRSYNVLLKLSLRAHFSDAQCGFKAIRADVARNLLPLVQDRGWFFDTELLVLAERSGYRIHEVPVDWVDDPDTRVDIVATARADLRGIIRLGRALSRGRLPLAAVPGVPRGLLPQLVRFALVGAASTAAYLILFVILRGHIGAQAANLLALLITAIANTAVNRRVTFGVRGSADAGRAQAQGLVVFGLGLALTSGSLWLLPRVDPHPGRVTELVVLVVANLAATLLRFLLLRAWVFRAARNPAPTPAG
jgi:putative flippase GtrA